VRTSIAAWLACPDCRSEIELVQADTVIDDDVVNGMLECQGCHRNFVIQRKIPLMLPKNFDPDQKREMVGWDSQVAAYDSNIPLLAYGFIEIPFTINALDLEPDYSLLDAGCGTGRMMLQLSERVKDLVCVDYSIKSLTEADRLIVTSSARNINLIQGDICSMPLRSSIFSRALCSRVIEHIPAPELREQALKEIGRVVLPGSTIVVNANQYSRLSREKSGEQTGGTHYIRFTEEELSELLTTSIDVKSISGLLVYLFVAICSSKQ
jgi:ubiquinone/menaquinone biosynthesis C-methylase UbiE